MIGGVGVEGKLLLEIHYLKTCVLQMKLLFHNITKSLNHGFTQIDGFHGFHFHNTSRLKVKLLLPKLISNPTSSRYALR